jgi:hypothetical protein
MKKIITISIIALIIVVSFANRVIYGNWNVFSYPTRVTFGGYYYHSNGYIVVLEGSDKPQHEVSGIIDRLTGKRIYSKELDFIGNGKIVYLHLDFNRYLVLSCGGGG